MQKCKSEGFSSAEIEQIVVSALYSAQAQSARLSDELMAQEIAQTRPLSVFMGEKIKTLRDWAKNRTVSAN